MTTIRERIAADLKAAMLAKDDVAKDALRMIKADLLNRDVELGRDSDEAESIAVLQKAVKSRKDSIEQYLAGDRPDAAAKEQKEIEIIERYLPRVLDETETRAAISALITELALSGKKDLGRVMKELKSRHGAAVDGKLASKLAGELLG